MAVRGDSVQITGTTFTGATAVKFGAVAATTFTVEDDSHITAKVPATAVTGAISVTTAAGTGASASPLTVVPPATVTGFTTGSGVAGTPVTINGTNFIGEITVRFNGVPAASVTKVSSTQLRATVPSGATTGKIAVTTIAGTAVSAANFTIPLAITGFSPGNGQVGDTVVITGTGFVSSVVVRFGTAIAVVTFDSGTQLTVTVPEGASSGPIVVSNGVISTSSAASFELVTAPLTSIPPDLDGGTSQL